MKATIKVETEVDVKRVMVVAKFRHVGDTDEDDVPTDFPLLAGDIWKATIDIDTGIIADWPQGDERKLHVKVCDSGSYYLIDGEGKCVAEREENYVPNELIPGDYGDYIILNIDGTGKITNWPKSPSLDDFFESDD